MPPSPSLRGSFRGDPRGDSHKRGRSLESGLSFREKDDDLALFNELQSKEKDNFLLQSTDDFEDLLSCKMKPFPELKLGINFSALGESSDLLNTDGDKNDYEWLLTPPETPLFPSLDDEPAHVNLLHNGRARSRPISISRSSTMEKSHRSSRGSPSPQRSSPSPRSGTSSFPGRPSSAPHSNPVPLHSSSPSRRPSPLPVKPSTPPRSLTPNSRRTITGSPVRTSRGNSSSPKVRAWQSNIPGFSLEAPPNLRTSLVDRPASYIRGSSPASRKSMSPTPSRSISSSHSQERDRLSSHSKGSIASSGDDDVDSLQSGPTSFSERPMSRKGVSGYPKGRSLGLSKKPTKTFSPTSAPNRSLDSAMRQMDRTTPQNMFRPLLSSVPSSTFYSGKTSSANCTLISRNSSVTTSSNVSSDLATSAAHDTEGRDLYQDDMASDCARPTFSDNRDKVFASDKMDALPEDSGHEGHDTLSEARLSEPCKGDAAIVDCNGNSLICSICGSRYWPDELAESENSNICSECKRNESLRSSTSLNRFETTESSSSPLIDNSEESHVIQPLPNLPLLETTMDNSQSRDISNALNQEDPPTQTCLDNSASVSMEPKSGDAISNHQLTREHRTLDDPSLEGAGISVLLNRSSSVKGTIVHGRTINSSAISFEDLSYSRDLTSSMRSSIGRGSFSASSSIDLTSTRHGEMFVRRQMSGKLSDSSSKPQSTVSSFSGTSVPINQSFGHSTSSRDGSFEGSLGSVRLIIAGERPTLPSDQIVALENTELCNAGSSVGRSPLTEASVGHIQNLRDLDLTVSSPVEEGTMLDNRVDQVDVEEDLPQCSLSIMSEIEINDSHPSSPGSQIDVVFTEDLEGSSVKMCRDTSVKDASPESVEYDQAGIIVEESTVTKEDQVERRTRSLTLEEATDTILLCSSIIHDIAYKAAGIAIEKEKENLEPSEGSRPTVTIPDKSSSDRKDPRGYTTGRTPKTQKARKRRTTVETEEKPPPSRNDDLPNEPVVRNVGLPKNSDSMKPPPRVESKCNCAIM